MVHRKLILGSGPIGPALNAAVELAAWAARRRRRFCVGGRSMLPTLNPGEFVLVSRHRTPVVGDLVVARHPKQDLMIVKRLGRIDDSGRCHLMSDNELEGADSRAFGSVAVSAVTGVVTISLERPLARLRAHPPCPV